MKTFLILTIAISFILTSCITQKGTQSNPISNKFYQRWKLDYGETEGTKVQGLPQSPAFDYLFKKDKTYVLYSADGRNSYGIWKYDTTQQCIFLLHTDSVVNGRIINIEAKKFTLIPDGPPVENSFFEKLRFHYVPKND